MTKRRNFHDPAGGRKALVYGVVEGFGPMLNTRHPKKFKKTLKSQAPGDLTPERRKEDAP